MRSWAACDIHDDQALRVLRQHIDAVNLAEREAERLFIGLGRTARRAFRRTRACLARSANNARTMPSKSSRQPSPCRYPCARTTHRKAPTAARRAGSPASSGAIAGASSCRFPLSALPELHPIRKRPRTQRCNAGWLQLRGCLTAVVSATPPALRPMPAARHGTRNMNRTRIAKTHLDLRWMHVHIHGFRRQIQKQHIRRIPGSRAGTSSYAARTACVSSLSRTKRPLTKNIADRRGRARVGKPAQPYTASGPARSSSGRWAVANTSPRSWRRAWPDRYAFQCSDRLAVMNHGYGHIRRCSTPRAESLPGNAQAPVCSF